MNARGLAWSGRGAAVGLCAALAGCVVGHSPIVGADVPRGPDGIGRFDVAEAGDATTPDVPAVDVPAVDVPAVDVPAVDVPAVDVVDAADVTDVPVVDAACD